MGYVVSFGTTSVANGGTSYYDQSVEAGAAPSHIECSLPQETYYFAIQARNSDGVMSAYSSERSVVLTVAVLISMFEATVAEQGVRLVWRVEMDEVVQGYRVYRSESSAPEHPLTDELLPAAATALTTGQRTMSKKMVMLK